MALLLLDSTPICWSLETPFFVLINLCALNKNKFLVGPINAFNMDLVSGFWDLSITFVMLQTPMILVWGCLGCRRGFSGCILIWGLKFIDPSRWGLRVYVLLCEVGLVWMTNWVNSHLSRYHICVSFIMRTNIFLVLALTVRKDVHHKHYPLWGQ